MMRSPRILRTLVVGGLLVCLAAPAVAEPFRDTINARPELWETPTTWPAEAPVEDGLQSIYYAGPTLAGHETRVFAFVGMPDESWPRPVPAIVLVHGGGGTAFAEFVRQWNARGYAAIAMDLEGHLPVRTKPRIRGSVWQPHDWAGPTRSGVFEDALAPFDQQWMFHAINAMTRAHTLLATNPEVDPQNIGLCGFSWGGILSAIGGGVDPRFRFVIPIYGCGHLDETDTHFGESIRARSPAAQKIINEQQDPSAYVPGIRVPSFWLNGTNDAHFPLNAWQKTRQETAGPNWAAAIPGMAHGSKPAWDRPESYAFADAVTRQGRALTTWQSPKLNSGRLTGRFEGPKPDHVNLVWTSGAGLWRERTWQESPAELGEHEVSVTIPAEATWVYFNAIDSNGIVSSSTLIPTGP